MKRKVISLPDPWPCACGAQGTWRLPVWGRSKDGTPTVWPGCPYGHRATGPAVSAEEYVLAAWPQRELARLTGVHHSTVYRWVHGITPLTERIRARIREALIRKA